MSWIPLPEQATGLFRQLFLGRMPAPFWPGAFFRTAICDAAVHQASRFLVAGT